MREPARSPESPAPAAPVAAPGALVALAGSTEAVLALQRTAGNQATIRALWRKLDARTADIERHAGDVTAALEARDQGMIETAFTALTRLDIKLLLDVLGRLGQTGDLGAVNDALGATRLEDFHRNRIRSAIDAVMGRASAGEGRVEDLPDDERDVVGAFGAAKPGTSGDDPDGNTYVVYDGEVRTYFMTTVEKSRRSSVWLANNPGNSDQLGGMGLGTSMKWGRHQFAIYATMKDGRDALWGKIKERPTLRSYLNYHLGQQPDGQFPEGNDPERYLEHIRAKVPWVKGETTPKEIEDRGGSESLLDGFMNAEGIVAGKVLTRNAEVTATMTPSQQKTMTFYLKLLGVRAK